jgi:hypothetical protein
VSAADQRGEPRQRFPSTWISVESPEFVMPVLTVLLPVTADDH